ncbi:MAG: MaoC family dehydratase [Rhodovibrionaceae bacterium]
MSAAAASGRGNAFEDFTLGQVFRHATPRSLSEADQALYIALTGSRFAPQCSRTFAEALGLPGQPLDDLLVFHIVFGRSVADISLNAVANLGYAECRFAARVYPGDTLSAESEVIGLKQGSKGDSGVVYVRTLGRNQQGEEVLSFLRWVLVNKRDPAAPAPETVVPGYAEAVAPEDLIVPPGADFSGFDFAASGAPRVWEDYEAGERLDHFDAMTVEEAEHQLATRLYQNPARVHFDARAAKDNRFGKRIVYGGHVMSLARAFSFNGLQNAVFIAAINAGTHAAPCFAGDTVAAWSEVIARAEIPGRRDLGALRLRSLAVKDRASAEFPDRDAQGKRDPSVLLDLDYWVLIPRGA